MPRLVIGGQVRHSAEEIAYLDGNPRPLIDLLRSGKPIDQHTREFLANVLEGKITKRRGPKAQTPSMREICKQSQIKEFWYPLCFELAKQEGETDAHRAACERVGSITKRSADQIDKIIYPRHKHR